MIEDYEQLVEEAGKTDARHQLALADARDAYEGVMASLNSLESSGNASLTSISNKFPWIDFGYGQKKFVPPSKFNLQDGERFVSELSSAPYQVSLLDFATRARLRYAYRSLRRHLEWIDAARREAKTEVQAAERLANEAFRDEFASTCEKISKEHQRLGAPAHPWASEPWKTWEPPASLCDALYLGPLWRPSTREFELPALLRFPGENIYFWVGKSEARSQLLQSLVLRAIAAVPPGGLRVTFIDAATLGEGIAPLLELSQYSDQLIDTKVWTSAREIEEKIGELIGHTGHVIQKYLTGKFDTITEYNRVAEETAEPYRLLVVENFPAGFNSDTSKALMDLMDVGPRCGVTTMLTFSSEERFPQDLAWEAFTKRFAVRITLASAAATRKTLEESRYVNTRRQMLLERFADSEHAWGYLDKPVDKGWSVPDYKSFRYTRTGLNFYFTPDSLTDSAPTGETGEKTMLGRIVDAVGRAFDTGSRVEVTQGRVFSLLGHAQRDGVQSSLPVSKATDPSEVSTWWTGDSQTGISAPFGRIAGSGVICLPFDSQLLSSALLAGRPGSGKSTLLHAVISSLAIVYPPSELELYLLDFKEGVEFMAYAGETLPHARVVAVEAER